MIPALHLVQIEIVDDLKSVLVVPLLARADPKGFWRCKDQTVAGVSPGPAHR
jgi:hypothetical protein